ncbi:MAG: hypothetical protein HS101_09095 [Planctomycetia bacterium]|nr:hypothetical protein [Planctomycetia bacterium]MCC7316672.1 hypothetical protein [Planctomycetota bacterium]
MERAVQTLNRLLAAEYGNLVQRLDEADPFVTWPAAEDRAEVRRMFDDSKQHQRELIQAIIRLRGAPVPPTYPTSVGGVHYLKLSFLMPQVVAGVRDLVKTYEQAGTTGDREADDLVARILADHQRNLASLQRLHSNLLQPS